MVALTNYQFENTGKEAIMTSFKELSRHEAEEINPRITPVGVPAEIRTKNTSNI
jgi:hypothetical protein